MNEYDPEPEVGDGPIPATTKGLTNKVVRWLLRSPLHFLLSRSLCLVEYQGRATGRRIAAPTQYVRNGENVIIFVGSPERKSWWRNFAGEDGHDLDLLVRRERLPMRGRAIVGADEPEAIRPLVETYLRRFPRASRSLGRDGDGQQADRTVVVWARAR